MDEHQQAPVTPPGDADDDEPRDTPAPYRQILRHRGVRTLTMSRLASRTAQSTLGYGTMVHLGVQGASQLQVSLVGSSSYFAPLLFGVQGGSVADSLSKRVALAFGFFAQAALCIFTVMFLGTTVGSLMFLMFMTSLLMQVVTPSIKAAVAIVASPSEMASVNAVISLVSSIGSALGSTLVAPLLINFANIDAILYVSAFFFTLGAVRVLRMDAEPRANVGERLRAIDWKPRAVSLRANSAWINTHRPIATMVLTGAIVVSLFEAFNTLIPVYVRDVLNANPAHAIYIFAPAGAGFFIATILAPWIIMRWGERRMAVVSLACMSIGMILFGLIRVVAPVFSIISPLRLLAPFGVHLSDEILAASVIAIPTNFGSTGAGAAVDNFVNRHVPVKRQGAVFGLKEVQENGLTIFTVLALGVVSTIVGPRIVMIVAPVIVILAVLWLLRYSMRRAGEPIMTRREAFRVLTADEPVRSMQD